jgi:hypothetical protein
MNEPDARFDTGWHHIDNPGGVPGQLTVDLLDADPQIIAAHERSGSCPCGPRGVTLALLSGPGVRPGQPGVRWVHKATGRV